MKERTPSTCITYPKNQLQNSEGPRLQSLGISALIVLSNLIFQYFQTFFPVTRINTVHKSAQKQNAIPPSHAHQNTFCT